jgi:Leucine-rich repeat (LRR) protein
MCQIVKSSLPALGTVPKLDEIIEEQMREWKEKNTIKVDETVEPQKQTSLTEALELHVDLDNFKNQIEIKNEGFDQLVESDFTFLK